MDRLAAIADSKAWNNTVDISLGGTVNLNLLCAAQKSAGCTPTAVQSDPLNYLALDTIQDASNVTATGAPIYTDSGTDGFNYSGAACTGYSTVTPNDICPFSYRLRVQLSCPSALSCLNPLVTVWGILQYSPSPNGIKVSKVNLNKYKIRIVKGVSTPKNDVVQVVEQLMGNYPPVSNNPSLLCAAAGITSPDISSVSS